MSLHGRLYKCTPQAVQHAYRLIIDVQAYYGSFQPGWFRSVPSSLFRSTSEGSEGLWQGPAGCFLCKVPHSGPVAGDLGWGIYLSVEWSVAGANLCTQYPTDSLVHFNASFAAQFCHSVYHISSTFLWVWLVHQ